jgi:aminoglycoside phosphotransferase (APT) family kinase protein/NDP-sugar pyrophosphorylase family protein
MGLAIVVLAAGLGTRYGGLKQLAPLGPSGEALLDYTLHDAAAAGFSEAVLVVGPEIVDAMTAHLDDFVPPLVVRLVEQPPGARPRARPWGTAYATLVGADDLTTPFAVANADDAYGAEAIAALAAQLRSRESEPGAPFGAVVGYAAGATLSSRGGVSRAVCRIDERGRLLHIEEHTGVRREAGRLVSDTATLDDTTLVSMNLWGFAPGFLDLLRPVVARFTAEHRADDRELRLPDVVGELVARGALDVAVLPTTSTWLGVTHPEDAPLVRERLAALEVATHFVTDARPVDATPLLHGHIHDTYVVTCRDGAGAAAVTSDAQDGEAHASATMRIGADAAAVTSDGQDGEAHASATMRIVLQRLNGDVFTDLDGLGANLELITAHLRAAKRPIVAEPVKTQRGGWIHVDATGRWWRASRFAEGTHVLGRDATTTELRAAARAFAELTRDLDDLGRDPDVLVDTIPRFHDLARRRADLATALARDRAGRATTVADLIDQANDLAIRLERELDSAGASDLPTRIVHNDAKLDNVLVDSATGAVACIVDLDTVMAGTVLNDFGELARTATSSAPEDEPDPALIELDHERFAALADGYVAGAQSFLLDSERDCLALAGPLLTLENGVRFLTDHLDGDVYFRIHRPDHNAQRARAQLALAAQMLEQLDALRDTVAAASLATRTPS